MKYYKNLRELRTIGIAINVDTVAAVKAKILNDANFVFDYVIYVTSATVD